MDWTRCGALVEPLTGRRCDGPELDGRIRRRIAELDRRGLSTGDRAFIHFGNSIEFFVDVLAVWWLGGCVVPVDPRLTSFEVGVLAEAAQVRLSLWDEAPAGDFAAVLERTGAELVVGRDDAAALPGPLPQGRLRLDDEALILFTSGTTGDPKGVVHTHRSLGAQWASLGRTLGREPFRRTLCLLPTHFGHGLICNSLFPWLGGADLHLLPPFRADVVAELGTILDEHRITFLSSVPSVWRLAARLARPPGSGSLERVFCGSAPLSAAMWRQIADWSGAEVLNAYGITETSSWVAGTTVPGFEPEDGLVGVPWGSSVAVLRGSEPSAPPGVGEACATGEEGFVWLETPALMKGYLDRPDLTAEVVSQGWFMTGDVGVVDERGRLYLRGRKREEINKGGLKVYPGDVDAVVERFPGVADACAFAIEDALYGQDVGIAVVLEEPADGTLDALRRLLPESLARHQLPARWYVVEAIPRTSRGKVNRAEVAAHCAGRDAAG